jgi:hypothetical protein
MILACLAAMSRIGRLLRPIIERSENVKYILMTGGTKAEWDKFAAWARKDIQAYSAYVNAINKELGETGALVAAEGLAGPDRAKVVRAGKDGVPITDGVFAESKEFLAGYWIVEVESADRAREIAARAPAAPGPVGAPMNNPIEVRQTMSGPPEDIV